MNTKTFCCFILFVIETKAICTNISLSSVKCDSPKDLRSNYRNLNNWKDITINSELSDEQTLESGFLRNVPNVNKVKFVKNINNIENNAFQGARHLHMIHFSKCYLPKIKNNWFNSTPLSTLVIKECQVTKLEPKCLDDTPKLKNVAIEGNTISKIRSGVFSYSNIEILYLNDNQIEFIEEDSFYGMRHLKKLGLEKNLLTSFEPQKYIGLTSPKIYLLWLSKNNIKRITKHNFELFPKLRILLLQLNDLEVIEKEAFSGAHQLSYLDISNNELTYLSPKAFPSHGLKYMDIFLIHNNRLTYFPTEIISRNKFPKLTKMTIGGNPWQCSCYKELTKYIYENRKNVRIICDDKEYLDGSRPICIVPKENEKQCVHNSTISNELYKEFMKNVDLYDRLPPLCKIKCSDTENYPCYAYSFSNLLYHEEP